MSISYQESKWNNEAISPTGVKGLMMLTKNTAKMLKVNRMLPNESRGWQDIFILL